MDLKEIENIIKAMSESDVSYLEIQGEDISIKMEKICNSVSRKQEYLKIESNNVDSYIEKENKVSNCDIINSPIVGTFYSSPGPEEKPFVNVGSQVKKGDVLCIIEAMKLMNEIECEFDGVIEEICVENEQIVEYGQPIFKIRRI
ncbi:biotin carboxyl carrier protein of acetyl-CoA carboxylase [Clostridium acetireducens DSM 10703]|uniref:Biotin carboxyl carrier protein of acetyl-CoA carboxylase n=1 Tax=Clostridium acetireducens DSM 10703 TaxID=1121290 RepID=A0A1E8EZR0_9CLOT|nr:acetyl-CoA carboxylase biotin carboxyl carrier protein [Clostridium acetireducens]OFI06618.1 biotin carboxyl carrier protein of acetyl-CoA carboxylase [Clostridium acetireducens DSM 10703]